MSEEARHQHRVYSVVRAAGAAQKHPGCLCHVLRRHPCDGSCAEHDIVNPCCAHVRTPPVQMLFMKIKHTCGHRLSQGGSQWGSWRMLFTRYCCTVMRHWTLPVTCTTRDGAHLFCAQVQYLLPSPSDQPAVLLTSVPMPNIDKILPLSR